MKFEVYSDGSATTADKPGGYAYVIVRDGVKILEGSGAMIGATNNDAEMNAAIEGLIALFKYQFREGFMGHTVTLVSDSMIVLNWASGKSRFKQEAKLEQYKRLMMLMARMNVDTRWVRGHAGDEHNERCDYLANAARKGQEIDVKPKRKTKLKTIGHRKDGIYCLSVSGNKKVVDLLNNICQDYSEAEHGLREVWIEIEGEEEVDCFSSTEA